MRGRTPPAAPSPRQTANPPQQARVSQCDGIRHQQQILRREAPRVSQTKGYPGGLFASWKGGEQPRIKQPQTDLRTQKCPLPAKRTCRTCCPIWATASSRSAVTTPQKRWTVCGSRTGGVGGVTQSRQAEMPLRSSSTSAARVFPKPSITCCPTMAGPETPPQPGQKNLFQKKRRPSPCQCPTEITGGSMRTSASGASPPRSSTASSTPDCCTRMHNITTVYS